MIGAPMTWPRLGGLAIVVAAAPTIWAAQPAGLEVRATASASEVAVADRFELTIRATAPSGTILEAPIAPETWGDFRVIRSRELPQRASGTGVERVWEWVLEPIEAGEASLPELVIRAVLPSGERTQAAAAPVAVRVISLLGENPLDTGAPQGLEEPPRITNTSPWVWGVAGIGVGALAVTLAGLGVRAWRRGRGGDELSASINDLEHAAQHAQSLSPQAVCDLVSRRVRGASTMIDPALAAQTPDQWRTAPAIVSPAADLLERCDRVRYAGETLTTEAAGAMAAAAADLVRGWRSHVRAAQRGGNS